MTECPVNARASDSDTGTARAYRQARSGSGKLTGPGKRLNDDNTKAMTHQAIGTDARLSAAAAAAVAFRDLLAQDFAHGAVA